MCSMLIVHPGSDKSTAPDVLPGSSVSGMVDDGFDGTSVFLETTGASLPWRWRCLLNRDVILLCTSYSGFLFVMV